MSNTSSTTISANNVENVLNEGLSTNYPDGTSKLTFNDTLVRVLAGKTVAGTAISMNDMRNKAGPAAYGSLVSQYCTGYTLNQNFADGKYGTYAGSPTANSPACGYVPIINVSATGHIQNLNIYDAAVAAGWNRSVEVVYTIPAETYIWSDSTSLPALTTGGAFPGGLTIINNGYIMGKGGEGGPMVGTNSYTGGTPGAGGPAINVTAACTITNNGYIGGGGGGGGAGGANVYNPNQRYYTSYHATGGGGAGGGYGGYIYSTGFYMGGPISNLAGGAPGAIGQSGGQVGFYKVTASLSFAYRLGGGGGRIMPGLGGAGGPASTSGDSNGKGGGAGGGGAANIASGTNAPFNRGGNGGAGGAAGESTGATQTALGGGGGGWGASGGSGAGGGGGTSTGGAVGGKAINKNGYSVTTTGTGTTYGGVS